MSRPVSLIDWNNPPQLQNEEFVVETSYDALNRPLTLTQPDGKVICYSYDKGGLLKTVSADAILHVSNITYNPKGQREHIYFGNNTKTRYYYNPLNFRLERLLTTRNNGQDVLQDLNYVYDAVGNIVQQRDNAQQTHYFNNSVIEPVCNYEYDALYRLTQATGRELSALQMPSHADFANHIQCPYSDTNAMQNYNQRFQYDKLGNILQQQSVGKWTRDYVYNPGNNYLLKHDQTQTLNDYTYDAHGNMLKMPHLSSMVYDYQNQLVSASNGTFNSYYNYDTQGNRTRKTVVKGNVKEQRYYIGGYELYRKHTNNVLDIERTTVNITDDEKVFARIEQKTGENEVVRYQYDNHLGSACLELDTTGQIISYEEYHPFGTTSYRSGRTETEVSLKRYKYCGKERDEETGLYYYGMRYYAAWLCRFINVDPLQFKYPELTPFQYASNNPITLIDLDGLEGVNPNHSMLIEHPQNNLLEPDPMGGLGSAINQKKRIEQLCNIEKKEVPKQKKATSYKRDIVNGEIQSEDIKQNRILEIEKGELKNVVGIILHRTASSTTSSTLNTFKTGRDGVNYGTHFVVGKDGEILQTANLQQKTWHVGKTRLTSDPNNSNSIGIEVVGMYNNETKTWDPLTSEQITAVANLVNYLLESYNLNPSNDVYVHEKISRKTAGEGQVVLDAIKDYLITLTPQLNSEQNYSK